jgi:SET domain-containing protein
MIKKRDRCHFFWRSEARETYRKACDRFPITGFPKKFPPQISGNSWNCHPSGWSLKKNTGDGWLLIVGCATQHISDHIP